MRETAEQEGDLVVEAETIDPFMTTARAIRSTRGSDDGFAVFLHVVPGSAPRDRYRLSLDDRRFLLEYSHAGWREACWRCRPRPPTPQPYGEKTPLRRAVLPSRTRDDSSDTYDTLHVRHPLASLLRCARLPMTMRCVTAKPSYSNTVTRLTPGQTEHLTMLVNCSFSGTVRGNRAALGSDRRTRLPPF